MRNGKVTGDTLSMGFFSNVFDRMTQTYVIFISKIFEYTFKTVSVIILAQMIVFSFSFYKCLWFSIPDDAV